jgi:hypothetical protein
VNITLAKPGLDWLTVNASNGDAIPTGGLGQDDLDGGPGHNHVFQ